MRLTNHPRARHEIDCSRSRHEQDDRITGEHCLISALIFELTDSNESSCVWLAGIARSLETRLDSTMTYESCSTGSACQVLAHLHHEGLARGTASAWLGETSYEQRGLAKHCSPITAARSRSIHLRGLYRKVRLLHVWQETSGLQLNRQRNASSALLRRDRVLA